MAKLDEVKWLVWLLLGWTFWLASGHAPQQPRRHKPTVRCDECGGQMRVVRVPHEPVTVFPEHALTYLDSGKGKMKTVTKRRMETSPATTALTVCARMVSLSMRRANTLPAKRRTALRTDFPARMLARQGKTFSTAARRLQS